MKIRANGEEREVPEGTNVSALLGLLEVVTGRVAVEVNREIVPKSRHAEHTLEDGDRVEIVTMVGGG